MPATTRAASAAHLGLNLPPNGDPGGAPANQSAPPAPPSPPATQQASRPASGPQPAPQPPAAHPPAPPAQQPPQSAPQAAPQQPQQAAQPAPQPPPQQAQAAQQQAQPAQQPVPAPAQHAEHPAAVNLAEAVRDPALVALWQQHAPQLVAPAFPGGELTLGQLVGDTLPPPTTRRRELPAIIPGFRADPAARPLPKRLTEGFMAGEYIPYSQLNPQEFTNTSHFQDYVIGEGGTLRAKGLDPRNDSSISVERWLAASQIAVTETRRTHKDGRAEALIKHHANVGIAAGEYGWPVAREYDI
ncbi:hypothetical protein BDY19DRAFT_996892 [Irpex rosettiformis]|uniref:Uncharacterized protein n=1 Tax=Irpex rosettiformis TaxID=378272 RepID=A0ACB8TTL4_9APHY|nr:hypothetical protein BDY19DRAFT_996892 [Irpex rosettiformis]